MTTKQAVIELLDKLPEDCTLDEIQYRLYLLQTVDRGRQEFSQGKKLKHEDVMRELRKKWRYGAHSNADQA